MMYTKYTYTVSIYCYYRLTSKFAKWNEDIYIYNPFPKFYSRICLDSKSV